MPDEYPEIDETDHQTKSSHVIADELTDESEHETNVIEETFSQTVPNEVFEVDSGSEDIQDKSIVDVDSEADIENLEEENVENVKNDAYEDGNESENGATNSEKEEHDGDEVYNEDDVEMQVNDRIENGDVDNDGKEDEEFENDEIISSGETKKQNGRAFDEHDNDEEVHAVENEHQEEDETVEIFEVQDDLLYDEEIISVQNVDLEDLDNDEDNDVEYSQHENNQQEYDHQENDQEENDQDENDQEENDQEENDEREDDLEDSNGPENENDQEEHDQDLDEDIYQHWTESEYGVPIFVCIRADKYLLTPFFDKCNYKLEDMISLFSVDEVMGCTLDEFFLLLRGNGGLIDAYNFHSEDELRVDIPELNISVTEDNIHTRSVMLDEILTCFYALRKNSTGEDNVPDKLTLQVSMQQRFVTRYRKLEKYAREGGTFGEASDDERRHKKRRLS